MSYYDLLQNINEEIIKCMKCGNCQAVCPIYKETKGESGVARGKIQMAKALLEGRLEYNEKLAELFSLCLTCKACADNCPCGVRPDKIILAVRAALAREKGLHPLKRRIFSVLAKPKVFRLGMNAGSVFQGLGLKRVKGKNLAHPRFPIGLDMRRVIRPLASQSLISELPRINKPQNPQFKVAFFTGCMLNYLYTDAGKAVVDVLNKNGVEVVIPEAQHCCGIPTFVHGDMSTSKKIAKYNIDVFMKEDFDAIITHCGTCIGAWVEHYPEFLADDPEYAEKANKLANKAYDFSQFLIEKVGLKRPEVSLDVKVTYHDPCHLVRGVGVATQPREILKAMPGVELAEMKKPDRCCGSAGSFSLTHYEMSSKIRDKKTEDILSVNPDAVITSCGACRMQLEDGLYQAGADIPVKHLAMLLQEAYQKEGK